MIDLEVYKQLQLIFFEKEKEILQHVNEDVEQGEDNAQKLTVNGVCKEFENCIIDKMRNLYLDNFEGDKEVVKREWDAYIGQIRNIKERYILNDDRKIINDFRIKTVEDVMLICNKMLRENEEHNKEINTSLIIEYIKSENEKNENDLKNYKNGLVKNFTMELCDYMEKQVLKGIYKKALKGELAKLEEEKS